MSTTTQPQGPEAPWPVTAHLDDILATVRPLEPIELQLLDAQGCVLVEDVTVPLSLPPFANSSMDGYAVRAADLAGAGEDAPVTLKVVGDAAAGPSPGLPVAEGEAVRIMTGAPLPEGADTVVPVEWTDGGLGAGPVDRMTPHSTAPEGASGTVRVFRSAEPGAHVREAGSDVREGDLALAAGTVLGPPQLGLLAALGRDTVRVRPRPRVVVLATGSELVQPGESLAPGQIHDSNSFALTAAARDAGAIAFRVGAIGDDAETLRATIEDQLIRADLVVTSGGVSVGAYDVVKEALTGWTGLPETTAEGEGEDVGTGEDAPAAQNRTAADNVPAAESVPEAEAEGARAEAPRGVAFRKLAMQPGKPQGFGTIGRDATPVLALPGNPVSAYVSFELFVRPAIRALAGFTDLHRPTVRAVVDAPKALTSPAGRRQYLRARHADGRVTPVGGASSHLVGALARADALLVVPEERTSVEPGEEVEVVLLG
ncbi:gephyrin-like molybdotransferase Glp [Streptomyces sp. NRRL F-5630]|uniref:molybdopterin molybdotransferase MoeA n=1 Tax=unclassified Streptomyces TaxID=2593676 RepID=UPI0004C8D1FA|nr:gephyrin-like molybdotransferase Glp [Streptomyces sp. NRRL F-5630]